MKVAKWIILILVFGLLVACSSQTPVPEQPLPEEPTPTATLAPSATALPEPETLPTPEPETEPTKEPPEISQPLKGWAAVSAQDTWVLITYGDALNPTVVQPGTYLTIHFNPDNDQVIGSAGCNSYFTSYNADDDGSLTIKGPIGTTKVACETGMEQEALFLAALETVTGYTLSESGELLFDYDNNVVYAEQMAFIPETPLVDTVWVLSAYGDPANLTPSKPGVVTTAVFSVHGTLIGFTGCNNYTANYTLQGHQITIGLGSTSLAACAVGMDQERSFVTLLGSAQSYRLGVDALEITTADGSVLRFSAHHLSLENVRWQLAALDGQDLPEGLSAHMLFTPAGSSAAQGAENTVNGSAGCNTFTGPYTLTTDTLTAGPFGLTRMMCEAPAMQVEQAFLAGLESAHDYQITGNQLFINTTAGSMLFDADRYPLEGPQWILTGSGPIDNPQPPVESGPFTATFGRQFGMPSGTKSGRTGCREYTATYFTGSDQFKVNLPQTSKGTCTDAQLEAEQGYFLNLNAAREYRILGSELYIYYDDNVFIFVGNYPAANMGPLAPLNATQWRLTSMDTVLPLPDSEITLLFEVNADGRTGKISGSGGCNPYNAQIKDAFMLSPIIVSAASCDTPEGVMEQEGAYLTALQSANAVSVEGNKLRITTDTKTLYFASKSPEPVEPTPTPAALASVIIAPGDDFVGETITFDGALSTPKEGISSYRWWFTGGETAEGVTVKRTYNKIGAYDAILTVTDAGGQKAEASVKVKIHSYLVGQLWISDDGRITLRFDGSKLKGNAGCNDYNAGYTAETAPGKSNDLSVSAISATQQICDDDDVMQREQTYLASLETASSYKINIDRLTVTTQDRSYSFNAAP